MLLFYLAFIIPGDSCHHFERYETFGIIMPNEYYSDGRWVLIILDSLEIRYLEKVTRRLDFDQQ